MYFIVLTCSPTHISYYIILNATLLSYHQLYNMKELTGALRKSNVRQASYLGARLASFDTNNDGHISIGELGK